ncbi:MAG: restriction endonuclease [Candidatus Aminicenantes bacterium]|nr:restriction endonuclease [Candidatus Aminicenantes bacterium]
MIILEDLRNEYHKNLARSVLSIDKTGIVNNADRHSKLSVSLARGIIDAMAIDISTAKNIGQTAGKEFERETSTFLEKAFGYLNHLRYGKYRFHIGKSIDEFEQYEHLAALTEALEINKELKTILGDYIVSPDIVIGKEPLEDDEINMKMNFIENRDYAFLTPLRSINANKLILHASISCKWTIRSDRSQNARTEGMNLIRNRKGHTPHIVIVTGEPYPNRIASLALGTGDIDCVYHFALKELITAANKLQSDAVIDLLDTMIKGKRLRDISDLPFDLII